MNSEPMTSTPEEPPVANTASLPEVTTADPAAKATEPAMSDAALSGRFVLGQPVVLPPGSLIAPLQEITTEAATAGTATDLTLDASSDVIADPAAEADPPVTIPWLALTPNATRNDVRAQAIEIDLSALPDLAGVNVVTDLTCLFDGQIVEPRLVGERVVRVQVPPHLLLNAGTHTVSVQHGDAVFEAPFVIIAA